MRTKDFAIPPRFWTDLSPERFMDIARNGLNADDLRTIWRMLGREDEPPKGPLHVLVNKADLEALLKTKTIPPRRKQ